MRTGTYTQCAVTTKAGTRCKNRVYTDRYCAVHTRGYDHTAWDALQIEELWARVSRLGIDFDLDDFRTGIRNFARRSGWTRQRTDRALERFESMQTAETR